MEVHSPSVKFIASQVSQRNLSFAKAALMGGNMRFDWSTRRLPVLASTALTSYAHKQPFAARR